MNFFEKLVEFYFHEESLKSLTIELFRVQILDFMSIYDYRVGSKFSKIDKGLNNVRIFSHIL